MASGAMADQLPNIRISSSGGTENLESYSSNHLEHDRMIARENKVRPRAPTEGILAFRQALPMAELFHEAERC